MNAVTTPDDRLGALRSRIEAACERIAPTWPLDRFVAVNPYWGWRDLPIDAAAARLGVLGGTSLTAGRPWFGEEWAAGRLERADLEAAAAAHGDAALAGAALDVLRAPADATPPVERMALATDRRDRLDPPASGRGWAAQVTHQISQHCAAHADRGQASWHPAGEAGLYRSWLSSPAVPHAAQWRQGRGWARTTLHQLPASPDEAIEVLLGGLAIPIDGQEAYLTALLLSVNGWASWYAHNRWQARLAGGEDDTIVELLAIRLAWEWLVRGDAEPDTVDWDGWAASWATAAARAEAGQAAQRVDWVLQRAAEHAYQRRLAASLATASTAHGAADRPVVQAVFCIDVRSEVLRRALEAVAPEVSTHGFAGFFGLPISYRPTGTDLVRPQLPALLAPALDVTEDVTTTTADAPDGAALAAIGEQRRRRLGRRRRWRSVRHAPTSMFTFVETAGLLHGPKLLRVGRPSGRSVRPWEQDGLEADERARLRPRLAIVASDPDAAADLAARVLGALGLTDGFAPLLLLCGHGAEAANNAHLAGLHCGACGGQRGDVNARALADLLNEPAVRSRLEARGITIPSGTHVVAGLHNTTTDEVTLFDTDAVPDSLRPELARLEAWLAEAGRRSRSERAPRLGLDGGDGSHDEGDRDGDRDELFRAVRRRATDWSQVRPEWGLAGNAAFVVAPRSRTRGVDLGGRVFLHDYDWRRDPDAARLAAIMTAPMVVTNWINLQYHASTVDNGRYGCGNKTLHNVVGGRIGVFEGNGGDLRGGLAWQSLHDGEVLRHAPLRLSVLIEAPRQAIDGVIAEHGVVRALVANGWLHLLRIDEHGDTETWTSDGWAPFAPDGR